MTEFSHFYSDTPHYTHEPGLAVMRELMRRLGDPQEELCFVHIAGTNGKGSCAAMTASVLRAAGFRTGLYTSPDLNGLHERMQVNGTPIGQADFEAVTEQVRTACAGLPEPSFFEKLTAAAFLYFRRERCDYVVLEVGLGGRLDATNIIASPACSAIMPIGLDHTEQLGDTLTEIAAEKCGIIKPGCPVVCASQQPDAEAVIRRSCNTAGSSLHPVDLSCLTRGRSDVGGQRFSYRGQQDLHITLLGPHQTENACAVLEIASVLALPESAVRAGLEAARWPCRMEYFPGTPPILLDGAHNPHGAAALAEGLRALFPDTRFTFILGVMADKDWPGILRLTMPLAERVVCLAPESPRALPADRLAEAVRDFGIKADCAGSPAEALLLARSCEKPVAAFGSFYYIGILRNLITNS